MKSIVITLYFLFSISAFAEENNVTSVCEEPSFLKCTNKNKQECTNSFNLSASYCEKKYPFVFGAGVSKLNKSMHTHMECMQNSLKKYYGNNIKNLDKCIATTNYAKKINSRYKE